MRYELGRFHRPMRRSTESQLVGLVSLGDGSTLNLDFTSGVLDSRLTFTRAANTATVINSSGLVQTVNADVPRFDHDPTTLAPRGLLIEGVAINYMLESTSLSGYSNGNMVAITSGNETDPEGNANSAKQIYANATTNYHGWYRSTNAGTNTTITISIWAKARNYTFLFMSDLINGRAAVRFNLQTGATDNNFGTGYVSASATAYPNGWWRCQMTATVAASTNYGWAFVGVPSGATLDQFGAQYTGTGNAADGIYCYGFQLEAGSGASSYIPTGASTVQRLADSCVMTGTNFSSWFAGATEGVLFTEFEKPRSQSGSIGHDHAAVGTRYSSGAGWILYATYADFWPTTLLWPTGGPIFPGGFPTSIPLVSKQAARWFGGNDATNFANGLQGTTGAGSGTLTQTMLSIGANSTSGTQADRDWLNACVRRVKFWPVALPNSQIIALTT